MVFSNAVLRWKNASALPGQSSGSKGFFSVKWNNKNLCDWKHSPFAATGLLLFLFVFIGVVRAKLGLKVFCFFYIYIFNNHSSNTKWGGGVEKKHRAHTTSKMRGCSASRLRHSFRLANVCQMCCAGWSGDTERAILPLTVTGGSWVISVVHDSRMMGKFPGTVLRLW